MRSIVTLGLLVVLALVLGMEADANAQTGGFVQVYSQTSEVSPAMSGGTSTTFDDGDWGISSFLLINGGWGEAYVGPTFSPIPELEASLSAGIQQGADGVEPRFATSVWAGEGIFSIFSILEFDLNGTDGLWFDITPKISVLDWFSLGLKARRFIGLGPLATVAIPESPVSIWAAWMPWDPESPAEFTSENGLLGVSIGF